MASKAFDILARQKGAFVCFPFMIRFLLATHDMILKEQVKCLFNLQCDPSNLPHHDDESEPWKIIVYDKYCHDIIVPLFSVQDLQSHGITLYLLIDQKRQKIPNVPAIYFVQPTKHNLDLVANDMKTVLYDSFYLNFSSGLQRPSLEHLANRLIASNSFDRLTKIYDQYINFSSLAPDLFSLNLTDCYQRLHSPKQSEQAIDGMINEIVQSLFCVIATLQTIPIIRAQTGGAAQMIGEKLCSKLSTHLKDRNANLFRASGQSVYQNRPC